MKVLFFTSFLLLMASSSFYPVAGQGGGGGSYLRATAGGAPAATSEGNLGAANAASRQLQQLRDWEFCTSSNECSNGCCSNAYSVSDGKLKCTPVGGFDPNICVSGDTPPSPAPPAIPPAAPTTGGNSGNGALGDWEFCTSSTECSNGCCSSVYSVSDGKLKCTPVGGFDPNICVSGDAPPPSSAPPATPPTAPTTPGGNNDSLSLEDWAFCTSSTECKNGCCSDVYSVSDGQLKCTPIGGFDANICVTSGSPSSGPVATPVPQPPTTTPIQGEHIGYYELTWTWGQDGPVPADSNENFSIAFSGWADTLTALSESEVVYGGLRGDKYISIGGGNENGRWTAAAISSLDEAINQGLLGPYQGIVYDIEEGDAGLVQGFANSFALAKSRGLKVIVTVSHSAPYGVSDSYDLMRSFFIDANIDMISPQLYTIGTEESNDYGESGGVSWNEYKNSVPAIVPSLVRGGSYYTDAQNMFENEYGIPIQGYIKWSQT